MTATAFQNMQFKRGSTSANNAFIGPEGSISIDTETGAVIIHDGKTPGGVFRINRGVTLNEETMEVVTAEDTLYASVGQTSFTVATADMTDPSKVRVAVDGVTTEAWMMVSNNQLEFSEPMAGGEVITVQNVKTVQDILSEATGTSAADIQEAINNTNSVGGIAIADILTVNDRIDMGIIN